MSWQDLSGSVKNFRKITIGNRNYCKLLKNFYYRLYKCNLPIAYNSVTEHPGLLKLYSFLVKNFARERFRPLIACNNSRPELLSLRRKITKYENIFYCLIHFSFLFLRNLFKGTFSEAEIFKYMV